MFTTNGRPTVADPSLPKTTPLHKLHLELGARMVSFAGWEMPIQYEGVMAEHIWCRSHTALFDVSHMSIIDIELEGVGDSFELAAQALETVTPAAVGNLGLNRQRYGVLTNDDGGIIDDLIISNRGGLLTVVVNAGRSDVDLAHLNTHLPAAVPGLVINHRTDLALIALQGPEAVSVLARMFPAVSEMGFLDYVEVDNLGISRSGYTGEDGFEIIVPNQSVEEFARSLLDQAEVHPAGLGARDTLRLEAGLPLYGQDLNEQISPVEAGLKWTIPKSRRVEGGFPGDKRILDEIVLGPERQRVGIKPLGRRPVREHTALYCADGNQVGVVTSGGFGPTVGGPVAMGYVDSSLAQPGQALVAEIRGKTAAVEVCPLAFVPHKYARGVK